MPRGDRWWFFRVAGAVMFAAALYHAAAIAFPAWGVRAYSSTYPLWRHILFIVNDT